MKEIKYQARIEALSRRFNRAATQTANVIKNYLIISLDLVGIQGLGQVINQRNCGDNGYQINQKMFGSKHNFETLIMKDNSQI